MKAMGSCERIYRLFAWPSLCFLKKNLEGLSLALAESHDHKTRQQVVNVGPVVGA